jgi:hypothetical protein
MVFLVAMHEDMYCTGNVMVTIVRTRRNFIFKPNVISNHYYIQPHAYHVSFRIYLYARHFQNAIGKLIIDALDGNDRIECFGVDPCQLAELLIYGVVSLWSSNERSKKKRTEIDFHRDVGEWQHKMQIVH